MNIETDRIKDARQKTAEASHADNWLTDNFDPWKDLAKKNGV